MKKSQGEVFGIALFFVVLIVGIIIYSNVQLLQNSQSDDSFESRQYELLSADALNALKKMSTSCPVEQNKDSLEDLIRYCFDYASTPSSDPTITCEGGVERNACEHSFMILNKSLQRLFKNTSEEALVAPVPFSLFITNPEFEHVIWHNKTISNVEDFGLSLNRSEDNFYLRKQYNRENAGFDIITTGRRSVELTFDVYYR